MPPAGSDLPHVGADETCSGGAGRSWWVLVVGVLAFAAAVLVPMLRQTGSRSWDTLFSEDGPIYAQQAIRAGGVHVLFRGYAGYVQLPPRLLALLIPLLPIRSLALYNAVAASVVNALLAWFVYHHSRGWINEWWLRLALAASVVLAPVMIQENTATITNTIWTFAAVVPWAFASRQERPGAVVARSGVAFLAATSTVLCVVYLPLALLALVARRTRANLVVTGSFVVGLVVQAGVMAHTVGQTTEGGSVAVLGREMSLRVFWFLLIGPRYTRDLWSSPATWPSCSDPC